MGMYFMELNEYIQELKQHDWYYAMSDDGRVYNRGRLESSRIKELAETGGEDFMRAYDDFWFKHFNPDHGFSSSSREKAPFVSSGKYKL